MTKPLQVYMQEDELARLDKWAKARGFSKSQAVRAAVRALTRDPPEDPLLSACGMIDGLPEDLSEHISKYLEETFVAEKKGRGYRRLPRSRSRLR